MIIYAVLVKKKDCYPGPLQRVFLIKKNAKEWMKGAKPIYRMNRDVGLVLEEHEIYDHADYRYENFKTNIALFSGTESKNLEAFDHVEDAED